MHCSYLDDPSCTIDTARDLIFQVKMDGKTLAAGLRRTRWMSLTAPQNQEGKGKGAVMEEMENIFKTSSQNGPKTFAFKALPGPAGSLSAPRPIAIGREERKIVTSECLSHLLDVHNLLN